MKRANVFFAVLLIACGGSAATTDDNEYVTEETTGNATEETSETTEETTEETTPAEPPGPTPAEVCTNMRRRERDCAEAFVPALVDLRIRIDLPAGTARRGRNARGRTGLITTARTEFTADSTDERIAESCAQFGQMPAAQTGPVVTAMQACIAETECAAFVTCDMPITEQRLRMPAPAAPAAEE